jgi:DNA-binding transcriptional regulator YiaG
MKNIEQETIQRVCYECQGLAEGRRGNYSYTECGLKNISLKNVWVYRCQCGAESVDIPNMDGLHRTIALSLLCKGSLLANDEIRFLRKVAGLTATELANNLGVTKVAVSRWENRGKISGQSDRSIRVLCGLAIIEEIVQERSGPVDFESVRETIEKLKQFLMQFNPKAVLPRIDDNVRDSGRMFFDPEHPMIVPFTPQLSTRTTTLLQ